MAEQTEITIEERLANQTKTVKALFDELRSQVNTSTTALTSVLDDTTRTNETKIVQVTKMLDDLEARLLKKMEVIDHQGKQFTERIAANTDSIRALQESNQRIQLAGEKLVTDVKNLTTRINGTVEYSGGEQIPIEQIRAQLVTQRQLLMGDADTPSYSEVRSATLTTKQLLSDAGGQMDYTKIRSSVSNSAFVVTMGKWFISVFGISGVVAAGAALTGVGKTPDLSPVVTKQATEIDYLKERNAKLEANLKTLENRVYDIQTKK